MKHTNEIKAAQIRAAAALTASLLQHVAPRWDEGRMTVEGLSSFAIDLYNDVLEGVIERTQEVYQAQSEDSATPA
jgi:hypothetical protein